MRGRRLRQHRSAVCGGTSAPGKVVRFNVGGVTEYPRGRGKLLLFTEGVRVRPEVGLADKLVTALSVVALEPHFSHDAAFDVRFPTDVAETLPGSISSENSEPNQNYQIPDRKDNDRA